MHCSPVIYSDCGKLSGYIEYTGGVSFPLSCIVRVWWKGHNINKYASPRREDPIYVMSFGNHDLAENKLLELLETPLFTVLKYPPRHDSNH